MSAEKLSPPSAIASCNRCKEKTEFDPNMILPNTWGKIYITIYNTWTVQEYRNLCPKCLKSLNEWMNQ